MSAIITALLAELDDQALDLLAERLAPRLAAKLSQRTQAEPWLNLKQAAEHLACPASRLYALVSAGRIPHQRDGSRLLFRRSELDEWIGTGGGIRP